MNKLILGMILLGLTGCARNVSYVKSHADARWKELGYQVVSYEGYNWSLLCGGDVWYSLKRADSPGALYSGYLCKWGDELQLYGPRVVSGDIRGLKSNDE